MPQFNYVSNAANGYNAQNVLQNLLLPLRQQGDLAIVVKAYRAGDPNARNAEQFYAPFMIQFNNGSRWIIFSTTKCRTDRVKGNQWDADNLKRLDPAVEKAVLTYPDDVTEDDRMAFTSQKAKYDSGAEISRIDDIVPNQELITQIKRRALEIFHGYDEEDIVVGQETETIVAPSVTHQRDTQQLGVNSPAITSATDEGRAYDLNGRAFESDIMEILNNVSYLEMMRCGDDNEEDSRYIGFKKMINVVGVSPSRIVRIDATAEKEKIGLLPSGGQPETDVWARFCCVDGEVRDFTFSCKRTKRDSVTVHQYTADAFADVLDPSNVLLRRLLNVFQFHANARDMAEEDRAALQAQLHPLLPKLCKWVLGGFGGEYFNPIQCAGYLVVYNPTDEYFAVHSVEDYSRRLLARQPLTFGTPFGWTYASKQRRNSIQLKMPVLR